jgi:hypothetical protein
MSISLPLCLCLHSFLASLIYQKHTRIRNTHDAVFVCVRACVRLRTHTTHTHTHKTYTHAHTHTRTHTHTHTHTHTTHRSVQSGANVCRVVPRRRSRSTVHKVGQFRKEHGSRGRGLGMHAGQHSQKKEKVFSIGDLHRKETRDLILR